jgi:hypothetical protein
MDAATRETNPAAREHDRQRGFAEAPPERDVASDELATSDERTYAVITHLVGLLAFLDLGLVISPVATLIMWQVKKGESHWLDDHLKEAMNFQLSLLIWSAIVFVIGFLTLGLGWAIGGVFVILLRLFGCIRAAVYANQARYHRYPASWRLIS